MTPTFFNSTLGAKDEHGPLVVKEFEHVAGHLVTIQSANDFLYATPDQAKRLGRSLIKAAKFVEKAQARMREESL